MNNKINLAVITLFPLIFGACTEDINLSFDSTYTRLVVDGSINTDTTEHKVTLLKSGDPLNTQPLRYVSNAIVSITDGADTFKLTEDTVKKGVYKTKPNVFGLPGKTYKLNISNVDVNGDGVLETYTASSSIKSINPIDSFKIVYQKYNSQNKGWLILLYSQDIGGRNFYCIKVYKNSVLLTDSLKEYSISSNVGFEGKYYSGLPVYFLNENKPDERLKTGDTITLELDGITEDYYNFIDGYKQEIQPKIPILSGPSANVSTNINPKDKAVGFFAAYSVKRKSLVYK